MNEIVLGGTPKTTVLAGTDQNNLTWTLDQPVGAKLILQVIDSQGSSGGVIDTKTVTKGQTTNCVDSTNNNNSDFVVSSNVTGNLDTCQPWGLRIEGGTKPYTLTIAQTNADAVTNVTMPDDADVYTYINRGDPGFTLAAAVSDATGKWAFGTPNVTTSATSGSTDLGCGGLISTSGNATGTDQPTESSGVPTTPSSGDGSNDSKKQIAITAGISVPLGVLLLGAIFWLLYRRFRPTTPAPKVVLDLDPYMDTVTSPTRGGVESSSRTKHTTSSVSSGIQPEAYTSTTSSSPNVKSRNSEPLQTAQLPNSTSTDVSASWNTRELAHPGGPVIQHQDSEDVAREIPPPYVDRGVFS
ncbi:hypothetical protein VKT23_013018 [Stygiomarasmius scandens]|uniref:Mid2 domain-containing protein n=1 Tax=Marasmiellus scandens TaxID=2682957 RepID=A0ABR1J877_9AGAR